MKSVLKDRKKSKSEKKDEKDETSLTDKVLGEGGGTTDESKPKDDKPKDDMPAGDDAKADSAPSTQAVDSADPVKTFQDVLDLDEMTAQAVFAEAASMPELAEMDPEAMAKKIKGNYDMLKKILSSMGEKAAMAMKDQLNQPMEMPEPGGPAPGGPGMGPGGPGGPGMGPGGAGGPPPMA